MFELLLLLLGAVFVKKQILDKPRAFTPVGPDTGGLLPAPAPAPAPQPSYPVYQQPFAPDTGIGPGTGTVVPPSQPATQCPAGTDSICEASFPGRCFCQPSKGLSPPPTPEPGTLVIKTNEATGCCHFPPERYKMREGTRVVVEPCPPGQVRSMGTCSLQACFASSKLQPGEVLLQAIGRCVGQGTEFAIKPMDPSTYPAGMQPAPGPALVLRANEAGPSCGAYWLSAGTKVEIEPCPPGQVREPRPVCRMAQIKPKTGEWFMDPRFGVGRCVGQGTVAAPGQTCKPGPGVVCPAPLPPNYPGMTVPSGGVSCPQKYPNASSMPPVYRPRLKTMKGLGVPANPTPRAVAQPNGIKFLLRLNGDERGHWTTNAENNWPVVQRADGYWVYAAVGSDGRHAQTNQIVGVVCPAIGG